MPNTVPATATGLHEESYRVLSRRTALARLGIGIAATTAGAGAVVVSAAEAGPSPELERLIAAHISAHEAEGVACRVHEVAGDRLDAALAAAGLKDCDADPKVLEERRASIAKAGEDASSAFSFDYVFNLTGTGDQYKPRVKRLLKSIEKDRLKKLQDRYALATQIERDSGVRAALRALDEAGDATNDAFADVCSFQCSTMADVRRLAGYVSTFIERNPDPDLAKIALRSLAGLPLEDEEA